MLVLRSPTLPHHPHGCPRFPCQPHVKQVEKPGRPLLSGLQCASLGYTMSLHGITLLSAQVRAQEQVLAMLRAGSPPLPPMPVWEVAEGEEAVEVATTPSPLSDFDHLYEVVGFDRLQELEERFGA